MLCVTMEQLRERESTAEALDTAEAIDTANEFSLTVFFSFFPLTLSGLFAKLLHALTTTVALCTLHSPTIWL